MTEIQQVSIPQALQGNDLLAAAKTGSGKTLAYIVPLLELLEKNRWCPESGLGAIVISPTRELAYQIFEVLRRVGRRHVFSAGLVIGGKSLEEEAAVIHRTNIIICTPGRLLQHMDETATFSVDNLLLLVLDEADRILDLGFSHTIDAIVSNLPRERQTLLFSATQTKSVSALARLSLREPVYVSVHEHAASATPDLLHQSYVLCELHEKLDLLWSLLRHHTKSKLLVFLSTCKQVRYVYECLRHLRPGVSLLALHGSMSQQRRLRVYEEFVRKEHAALLATDVAARGLDFPRVDFVVQLDCPEDANTYIHRAGRTARFNSEGECILVLMPTEETEFQKLLAEKKVSIEKIRVNSKKRETIVGRVKALLAGDPELKEVAKRAVVAYLRSLHLASNKRLFRVDQLDMAAFADSYGLASAPRIRFVKARSSRQARDSGEGAEQTGPGSQLASTKPEPELAQNEDEEDDEEEEDEEEARALTAVAGRNSYGFREPSSRAQSTLESGSSIASRSQTGSSRPLSLADDGGSDDDDDEILVPVKREPLEQTTVLPPICSLNPLEPKKTKLLTRVERGKKLLHKKLLQNSRLVFAEDDPAAAAAEQQQAGAVGVKEEPDSRGERAVPGLSASSNVPPAATPASAPVGDDESSREPHQEEEEEEERGGIDIESSRQLLQRLDAGDKLLFQERIKRAHREKRMKERELNRKRKQSREVNDEASRQDDEGEPVATLSHAEPSSLDLLPDPDVLYPKRARRRAKNSTSDADDSDEDEDAVNDGGSSGEAESEGEATDCARGHLAGDEAAGTSDSDHVDSGEPVGAEEEEEAEAALPRPVRQLRKVTGKQTPAGSGAARQVARGRHNLQRDQLLALALLRRTPPSSVKSNKINKSSTMSVAAAAIPGASSLRH